MESQNINNMYPSTNIKTCSHQHRLFKNNPSHPHLHCPSPSTLVHTDRVRKSVASRTASSFSKPSATRRMPNVQRR